MANHPNMSPEKPAPSGSLVHVVVRLVDGDRVLAASVPGPAEAQRVAEELLSNFAQTDTAWPLVDGRYVRPEAVVSIDLVTEHHRRWSGSAERAKIMDAPDSAA
jgi:hypothetical protein